MQVFSQSSVFDDVPDNTVVVLDELYDAPQIDGDVDVAQNIMERARNSMMTIRIGLWPHPPVCGNQGSSGRHTQGAGRV